MENINIRITKATRFVDLSKNIIGNDGENLQENLVFSFNDEFVDGQARLELIKTNKEKSYITLTKVNDTYQVPVKSIITKVGKLDMQLVITEGTNENEIPIFKSNTFYMVVNPSINAIEEAPEGYDQWIDIANEKLNEMDNLDIDAEQTSSGATITITKKDGTEQSVNLTNGQPGQNGITPTIGDNGNWYLGTTDTGKPSRGIQGETGSPGQSGVDGFSPIANVSKSGSVATISITDKNGTTTASVSDGTNGRDGTDGYSPSASVSQSGDTTTISITDKNGTTTANIDLSGKLNTSKVKTIQSTTSGDVYDVTYINGLIGNINTILATLTTPGNE